MNVSASAYHSSFEDIIPDISNAQLSREAIRELVLVCRRLIESLRMEAEIIRGNLAAAVGELSGQGIMFARNKYGFTKSEAKKLFFSLRGGKQDDDDGDEPEKNDDPAAAVVEAKGPDEKIERIIDYMRETSTKLDRIEDDIQFLKNQVDRILEKI